MTDWDNILERWGRLIPIKIAGRTFRVPENNLLLRCLQYLEPERVSYGDFCWNAECNHCKCVLCRGGARQEILCCQTVVREGDALVELSPEISRCIKPGKSAE